MEMGKIKTYFFKEDIHGYKKKQFPDDWDIYVYMYIYGKSEEGKINTFL